MRKRQQREAEALARRSTFLDDMFDPKIAPRLAPAARAMALALEDREWHSRSVIVSIGVQQSDVKHKTANGIIATLILAGRAETAQLPTHQVIRLVTKWPS